MFELLLSGVFAVNLAYFLGGQPKPIKQELFKSAVNPAFADNGASINNEARHCYVYAGTNN